MKRAFSWLPLLVGAALSACTIPQQIDLIEREQRRIRTENVATRDDLEGVRSTLADNRANLQQVQTELTALREKVEELQYHINRQIGQSAREGGQRIKELEERLAKIDNEVKVQATLLRAREEELRGIRESLSSKQGEKEPAVSGPSGSQGELAREKPSGESEEVKRDYAEALKLLEQKDYRGSIARFKEFLKKYPKSDYADNAQYWIGEGHYALKEFDQSILEFDAVRRKFPKGDKVPAALLKMGFAFAELGDKVDARLILQELIDRYPQSEEAVKARQKVKTLES